MTSTRYTSFEAGLAFGLLIGLAMAFLITRSIDRHADFWRAAYCSETLHDLDFCRTP